MPSGKSIIEEWRNPPKYTEDLLQSDRVYEERAVDVIINHGSQDFSKRLPPPPKITNGNNTYNINGDDNRLIKIKRPQGGGTVRSIPIKDYQASIAHNIGTLRRSAAPQSQFESLVSEPEKSVYVQSKRRIPTASSLHHRTASQATCTASQLGSINASERLLCYFCNNQRDQQRDCCCANADPNTADENLENHRYFDKTDEPKSQDGSDIDEYFRRSSHRRFDSHGHRASKHTRESLRGNAITTDDMKNERMRAAEKAERLRLEDGHVGQKISAYEQNARRSLRDSDPRYRSLLEVKGHRTIGVPLVGMHNACGLPVVASWHDHELLEPLRISRRIVGTVGPVYKHPRTIPNMRRRTQPKRKAPQPDRATSQPKDVDRNFKRSTIKSLTHLDAINGLPARRYRRSSFTTTKVGSLSSKNSFKRTTRYRRQGIKASSLMDTLGKRSIKGGSAKRATLYAKDDGEEAVEVLKNLCLNPLARTNPETDMMW